jgi:glycerol-3-phosphate acyltransferase PlsY
MFVRYWWQLALLTVFSYFIGNFSAAIYLSNKFIHKDIRTLGSKNPGTTNMARVFGIKYGIVTLLIDFLKGFICAFAGKMILTSIAGVDVGIFAGYLAGLAVILGHNYPIVLGFKGGKGFASGIGVFIAVAPTFTLLILAIGIVMLLVVDRMSVCALAFFTVQAVYHLLVSSKEYWWIPFFTSFYLVLAVVAHWPNIIRLMHGEETPLGIINSLKKALNN